MKIFLVKRNDQVCYDEFDSFVCVAETITDALRMIPLSNEKSIVNTGYHGPTWPETDNLDAELLGEAGIWFREPQIICSSFNAG